MDGSIRPSTLFHLSKEKGMLPEGVTTLEQFMPYVTVDADCKDLPQFLSTFKYIQQPIVGDHKAIERIARESVQDLYNEGHVYAELR